MNQTQTASPALQQRLRDRIAHLEAESSAAQEEAQLLRHALGNGARNGAAPESGAAARALGANAQGKKRERAPILCPTPACAAKGTKGGGPRLGWFCRPCAISLSPAQKEKARDATRQRRATPPAAQKKRTK